MTEVIRHVAIDGRVQGVGYRAWLAHTAEALGLAGWVRNRRDGSVEAVLAGPEPVVTDMIAKCRRGPSAARVDNVIVSAADSGLLALRETNERFSILSTL